MSPALERRRSVQIRPKEKEFLQHVLDIARWLQWSAYHTHNSKYSEPGFPDLCMVRGDRLVFAELKTTHGKLTPAQTAWLEELQQVPGVEVHVWRPEDIREIYEVLRGWGAE